ncbi:hypothetical protein [Paracoccus litorisediminis]|uniref:Uncharacterized protein n=1 Tax=Paracoccus litorisediminis TaxID=2006130 RepID=A0A844HNQ2_9RHOB|nr:hypothetical protein [Paracoccus litorisediminis]MTH60678.1 hypothetical protein [Paracoccus litorisediminis]
MSAQEAAPSAEREKTFGSISVRVLDGGGIEIIRKGASGRGKTLRQVMWHPEQIEAAWIAASSRRGTDARDQSSALRWALDEIANG